MKKQLLLLAFATTAIFTNAQKIKDADVPAAIKQNFEKQFPNAKVNGWEKEKGNYEVEMVVDKKEISLLYDVRGSLVETETEIKVTELPSVVTAYCTKNYTGKTIKEASRIVDAKGIVTYEAEINNMDVLFDERGNFLREEKD